MACLPNDAPAADFRILRPVGCGNGACIHSHDEAFRTTGTAQQLLYTLNLRREATIKPDHQQRTFSPFGDLTCRVLDLG